MQRTCERCGCSEYAVTNTQRAHTRLSGRERTLLGPTQREYHTGYRDASDKRWRHTGVANRGVALGVLCSRCAARTHSDRVATGREIALFVQAFALAYFAQ